MATLVLVQALSGFKYCESALEVPVSVMEQFTKKIRMLAFD